MTAGSVDLLVDILTFVMSFPGWIALVWIWRDRRERRIKELHNV